LVPEVGVTGVAKTLGEADDRRRIHPGPLGDVGGGGEDHHRRIIEHVPGNPLLLLAQPPDVTFDRVPDAPGERIGRNNRSGLLHRLP
jgi:hypothetical protein